MQTMMITESETFLVSPKSFAEHTEEIVYSLFDEHVGESRRRRRENAVAVHHETTSGRWWATIASGEAELVAWTVDPFAGFGGPGLYACDGVCSGYLTLSEMADAIASL